MKNSLFNQVQKDHFNFSLGQVFITTISVIVIIDKSRFRLKTNRLITISVYHSPFNLE